MSIMSFRGSLFARVVALITLTCFIAGCLPQNVKSGGGALLGTAGSLNNAAGGLLASLGSTTSAFTDLTGVAVPGASRGMDNRSWSSDDQLAAIEAAAAFRGEQADDLPLYDPLKPGEAKRYKDRITILAAKYKGRKTLKEEEMQELTQVLVPVARYLAKSRTYRSSVKEAGKLSRNPRGQSSVTVPAGMTLEVALLTYCNDYGLPAPWRGEKLSMRSSAAYIPSELREFYSDLHAFAATHPAAHYQMQSTVWWIRGGTCNFDNLSDKQKQMIEAAHAGGLGKLQSYCSQQKIKKQIASKLMQAVPGMGAGSQLSELKSFMTAAADYQSKAQVLLSADLSNPQDLLQLAKSSGITNQLGSASLLKNPQLSKYAPLLNQAGLAKALIPNSDSDKAVATSLSVMEELGRQIGEAQGVSSGSLANYSKIAENLYVESNHNGGASNSFIKVRNTGTTAVEITGSDFVLTSVTDDENGRKAYQPTQRLSIGPMQPVRVYPNEADAAKRYTIGNEQSAIDALSPMKGMDPVLESEPDQAVAEQCAAKEKAKPGSGSMRFGDYGIGIIRDVIQTIPILGTAAYAYSAFYGKDWMTGAQLSQADQAIAAISAVLPGAGIISGLKAGAKMGKAAFGQWTKLALKGESAGGSLSYMAATGIKASEGVYSYLGGDGCTAWASGASAVANLLCAQKGNLACSSYTMIASAVGNFPQSRGATEAEIVEDLSSRLEYALAPPGTKLNPDTPEFLKTFHGWLNSKK